MSDRPDNSASTQGETKQPRAMDEQGIVGKQFTEEGAVGGTGQKMGGPFDKSGTIGKQFTSEGMVGGTVQDAMGGEKKKS